MSTPSIRAQKILRIRQELNINPNAFALKCGYARSSIVRIEEGQYDVQAGMCRTISKEFGVKLDWLMDDERSTDEEEIFAADRRIIDVEAQSRRLLEVFEASGLTVRAFNAKLGVGASSTSEVMKAERPMTERYAEKVEHAFGYGVDWLLYGVEEAKENPLDDAMSAWLKIHPEWRARIKAEMEKS